MSIIPFDLALKSSFAPYGFLQFRLVLIMVVQANFFLRCIFYCLCVLGVTASAYANEWQQRTVPMVGVVDYMREVCVKFAAGDRVQYRFESGQDVQFDIHYHPEAGILFKERKDAVKQLSGEFTSDAAQLYCFTWKNKRELNSEWKITLNFLVLP